MTDNSAPVSVIIPCFLCLDTIERAVLSVLRQTFLPREILLVDDASPDDGATVRELKRLAEQHANLLTIRVIESSKNAGPGSARNRGWELACQPYVAFLDADDIWFLQKIEYQYAWMCNHPEYTLTCHEHVILSNNRVSVEDVFASYDYGHDELVPAKLLYLNPVATRTVMLRRESPHKFIEEKRYSEDYFLWLTIVLRGGRAAKLKPPLAGAFKCDFGVGGLSSRLIEMEIGELNCYFRLYQANLISVFTLIAVACFSLLKFFRRIFLTTVRKLCP